MLFDDRLIRCVHFLVSLITLFILLIIFPINNSWSRPPSEIILEYNSEDQILTLNLKHVTKNSRDHRIHRIFIFKNDEQVEKFRYVKQTNAQGIVEKIPMELKTNDVVRVKAVCNKAGYREESLIIP